MRIKKKRERDSSNSIHASALAETTCLLAWTRFGSGQDEHVSISNNGYITAREPRWLSFESCQSDSELVSNQVKDREMRMKGTKKTQQTKTTSTSLEFVINVLVTEAILLPHLRFISFLMDVENEKQIPSRSSLFVVCLLYPTRYFQLYFGIS